MSAEAFLVWYGIRKEIDGSAADELELLELRSHPWQLLARQKNLKCWWGQTIDEQKYFLLLGAMIGRYGWEGEAVSSLSNAVAASITAETEQRLREAGIVEAPAWHFQFEPDF